ncbi:MAG: bifunctional phosphopantothenoylcysteine decarboxylase/phosphopantothenate--cysteine ligase CoaBC [Armatimonadetes bacterium]|nr:bifunctional phosphopantothenoylcysteine decarboxylase/phosphopantothenate--cysteine ligase CoaBC [Armatimonadota bacterium]
MNVLLGVSGSIAAYRAADLARELMRSGHSVRACLTDAAQNFVSAVLFETLTGNPCLTDTFQEPIPGRMAHIDWARQADIVVIAPATANTINKIAQGIGDDMLTTLALVSTRPMVVAPAMNPQMYLNDTVQASLQTLHDRGIRIVEPAEGDVACGEHGQGKLASIAEIVQAVQETLATSQLLAGKRVLITSGPTQEPIDSVRYLSNRSSGKMGSALARAALQMGATVTVVAGPQTEPLPLGADVHRVTTALEMHARSLDFAAESDFIIGVAAVADYRVAEPVVGKIRRESSELHLELVANPDIIADLAKAAPKAVVVGFAAEPTSDVSVAQAKIMRKGLAAIAANDVSDPAIGFGSDRNRLQLVFADGQVLDSGQRSKFSCAWWLLEAIAALSVNQT